MPRSGLPAAQRARKRRMRSPTMSSSESEGRHSGGGGGDGGDGSSRATTSSRGGSPGPGPGPGPGPAQRRRISEDSDSEPRRAGIATPSQRNASLPASASAAPRAPRASYTSSASDGGGQDCAGAGATAPGKGRRGVAPEEFLPNWEDAGILVLLAAADELENQGGDAGAGAGAAAAAADTQVPAAPGPGASGAGEFMAGMDRCSFVAGAEGLAPERPQLPFFDAAGRHPIEVGPDN
jgi:hypothetical protein